MLRVGRYHHTLWQYRTSHSGTGIRVGRYLRIIEMIGVVPQMLEAVPAHASSVPDIAYNHTLAQ
eukprot:3940808-Rhodomonas_salina.3